MHRQQIIAETRWTNERTLQLASDFAHVSGLSVINIGQPAEVVIPQPNAVFVLVWGIPEQIDLIESDPRYADKIVPGSREALDEEVGA